MAIDPTFGVVPPLTDEDYAAQLAAIDAQLFGTPPPAPVPPMAPAPMPVDTPLVLPRGSNERQPEPPPPPDAQQVGFAPPGPVGLPDVNAEVAPPPAAPPQPEAPTVDEQLAPQGPQSTGINWLDEQLRARDAAPPPVPELTAEEQAGLLLDDPNAAEELRFNLDRKRADIIGRGSQDALRKYHEDDTAALAELAAAKKRHADEMTKVDAEVKQLNNTEVDEGQWWSSRSTFQQIAAVLAAVAGGFSSVKTGRNAPLEMIQNAIERNIEVQKANIANKRASASDRRNALALAYGRLGDMAQAESAARVAAYDKAIAEAETAAQQFDPRGTQALGYYDTIMGLRQRRAQAWDEAQQKSLDREIQLGEYNLKVSAENRARLKDARAGSASVVTPGMSAALASQGYDIPAGAKLKDVDWTLGTVKKLKDINAPAPGDLSPKEIRELEVPGFKTASGEQLLARSGPEARELREQAIPGTRRVVQLASKMREIVRKSGGITAAFQTAEGRQLQAATAALYNELRTSNKMGTLDAGALKMVEMMAGGGDTTGWRSFLPTIGVGDDAEAGFKAVAENQVAKLNELLLAQDENAAPVKITDFADFSNAESTPDDKGYKAAESFRGGLLDIARNTQREIQTSTAAELAKVDTSDPRRIVPPSVRRTIDGLAGRIRTAETEEEREQARAALQGLTERGGNPGIRALAQSALLTAITGDSPTEPAPVRQTTNVEIGKP